MKKKSICELDAQEIRRAADSMLANHGSAAAEIAMRRARNLAPASEARLIWEHISATLSGMQANGRSAAA
jgi:hypothetical protein